MKNILWIFMTVLLLQGCRRNERELIIFHAGSLSVPFKQLASGYEKKRPGLRIYMEPSGSLVCARKITELHKPCDIIASADYIVIDELIVPEYADWSIIFATNEMVLAYTGRSSKSALINKENWYDIISSGDVTYARADPDSDPGGYRAVLTLKLAEKYYGKPGLADNLMVKDKGFIRPKEVDLIAMLESNAVDYAFIYKSVAVQHDLAYVSLPGEINLSDPKYNELYKKVSYTVRGNSDVNNIEVTGESISYSLAILKNAVNQRDALGFVDFLLSDEGIEIFRKCGQDAIHPFITQQPELIPGDLKKHLKPLQTESNGKE